MTISLHSFCKDNGLAKSTVHRWLTEQGHPTSNGVPEELQAAILAQFAPEPEPSPEPEPASIRPEVTVLGTVEATMQAPSFTPSVALARLRGGSDNAIAAYADPMAAISQALELFDAAESAMAQDLAQRQALLQQTQAAARVMAAKASQLQAQQAEYRIKSDVLSLIQGETQANLGELLAQAQAIGGEA